MLAYLTCSPSLYPGGIRLLQSIIFLSKCAHSVSNSYSVNVINIETGFNETKIKIVELHPS